MKKFFTGVLALFILICMMGCTQMGEKNTTENESEEIVLTSENIHEYLSFSSSITDVKVEHFALDYYSGEAKMNIKTSPLQRGDFVDVRIQVKLESLKGEHGEYGWSDVNKELIVPFDGKIDENFDIKSSLDYYVSDNPYYTLVVESVSGTFVKQ